MIEKSNKPIYVTQPTLPPLKEFTKSLEKIWSTIILTNNGPFHQQFEKELVDYLGVKHISVFTNGTLALMTALQALRITGEVITTPYSFVATSHSLSWNNIKPIFADIEPNTYNLDPKRVEAAITPQTTAIMPVHVYGNPCNLEALQHIANTYGLKLIYDAAHAFGVKLNGNSILNYGDLSILSFHATKVFNTIEGGAIVCPDEKTKKRIDYLKNFGFVNETTVIEPGINAKMNELQAAYGLLQLKEIEQNIAKRRNIASKYKELLSDIKGIAILQDVENVKHNYAYFPIFVKEDYPLTRDELYFKLKENNIYGRRYFYPLISAFSPYRGLISAKASNLPIATTMAEEVICLPIYPGLKEEEIEYIHKLIKTLLYIRKH